MREEKITKFNLRFFAKPEYVINKSGIMKHRSEVVVMVSAHEIPEANNQMYCHKLPLQYLNNGNHNKTPITEIMLAFCLPKTRLFGTKSKNTGLGFIL